MLIKIASVIIGFGLCIVFMDLKINNELDSKVITPIKIIFSMLLLISIFFIFGKEIYSVYEYGLNSKKINFIKKNLSEEEKLKYEYYINNLSTYEEKEKFSTYMYLKLKGKENRRIENMVNSF
mgnify:FL=1